MLPRFKVNQIWCSARYKRRRQPNTQPNSVPQTMLPQNASQKNIPLQHPNRISPPPPRTQPPSHLTRLPQQLVPVPVPVPGQWHQSGNGQPNGGQQRHGGARGAQIPRRVQAVPGHQEHVVMVEHVGLAVSRVSLLFACKLCHCLLLRIHVSTLLMPPRSNHQPHPQPHPQTHPSNSRLNINPSTPSLTPRPPPPTHTQ